MASSLLSQRTQLDFGPSRYKTFEQQPSHLTPSHYNTQLQFNLGSHSSPDNLATKFRKPPPIIIETLKSNTGTEQPVSSTRRLPETIEVFSHGLPLSVNSSVSSEKLVSAIRLAKRDIKKAKELARYDSSPQEAADHHNKPSFTVESMQKPSKKARSKTNKLVMTKEQEKLNYRVQSAIRRQTALGPFGPASKGTSQTKETQSQYYFYPAADDDVEYEGSDGEKQQAREIKKLRKELQQYMKQLDELRHEGPAVLRNKDKRIKKKKENEFRLSDDEADRRQTARAEEQAARSARILYVLQRQIKELEDEINKRGRNIKHTKKTQTLSRLAAAHRGAVRALQSFISHAPLQPKSSHGLPPMYQELSLLIRQLSLLSAQVQIGGESSLPDDLFDVKHAKSSGSLHHSGEDEAQDQSPSNEKPVKDLPQQKEIHKGSLNPPIAESHGSPNPTPERDAILKAGLAALVRARKNPGHQTTQNVKERFRVPQGQQNSSLHPTKRSILLPAQLQVKRQKAQIVMQKNRPTNMSEAHFAQHTVSSKLKKAPPVSPPRVPSGDAPTAYPARDPVSSDHVSKRPNDSGPEQFSPDRSPRRKLEEQMQNSRRMPPIDQKLMERELARQQWLDKETEKKLRELDELCDEAYYRTRHVRHELDLPKKLVSEAERAIRAKLQPLLDRAEAIVRENIQRETRHQQSLRRRLAGLASDATMSQANQLADLILDEILEETVDEMQRLESDDEAEAVAENLHNRTMLETLFHRLQSFERTEESIRRHWVQIKYDDPLDGEKNSTVGVEKGSKDNSKHHEGGKIPKPIVFTSSQSKHDQNFVSKGLHHLRKKNKTSNSPDLSYNSRTTDFDKHGYRISHSTSSSPDSFTDTDTSSSHVNQSALRLGPRHRLKSLEMPTVAVCVPSEMRASIAANRSRYERYLRQTTTHIQGTFDPWKLVQELSDDLFDDLLSDVAEELHGACDDFAENVYLEEFAVVKPSVSPTQSQTT